MCNSMMSYFGEYDQHHNATLVVNRYDSNMIIMYVARPASNMLIIYDQA